ncbi:MAG TPA: GH1 family beta-glucosidase [Xanthobacteraceae bacterium]|nr:GH1 family beta-glucosidase [Xanthobacteraceae bacterium]
MSRNFTVLKVSRRKILPLLAGALGARGALHARTALAEETGFPADFVWGASTSAYQIEGAVDADGRGKSIWDAFCHTPGKVKNGDTGDVACDHYHRWRDDITLLARGGFNAYRFSVAWPRIMPAGVGEVETRGLDFYDRLVDGLLARNITPWLCLYHWDLPQALQDKGGWLTRDIAEKFADYARVVAHRLGDRVKHWAMFNEPGVHALFGYGMGNHAPGLTGLANMLAAIHHQNLAQGRALQALRAEQSDFRLGTVLSLQPVRPSSDSEADHAAVARFDAVWDGALLDPLFKGFYPPAIADDVAPLVAAGDLQTIRQPVDFLGVNYYAPAWVTAAPESLFGAWFGAVPKGTRFTAMGWPIDAGGMTDILARLRDDYGNPELYVTENGACYDDTVGADGMVHDADRIAYLREHVAAAGAALAAGVKLRGYFVWSLFDNFEWAEGYSRRFGVIRVDFANQQRTPKASFAFLADTIKWRG